jgi:CheY-like chemotaxis protein
VEAADNVVHAYDLNMQMPETPLTPDFTDSAINFLANSVAPSSKDSPLLDSTRPLSPSNPKRQREEPDDEEAPSGKRMFAITEAEILQKYFPHEPSSSCGICGKMTTQGKGPESGPASPDLLADAMDGRGAAILTEATLSPNHRHVVTRDFMRQLLNEALRNGHPTSEVHTETDSGEVIEVRTISSRGVVQDRKVSLRIEPGVPEIIIVEELHLQFALQKIVDNAIKFTDDGSITVTVKIARNLQIIEIWVVDTGCGIGEESKSNLFKPHFQADASISRARDGLGLSLFNAKAHVRKNLGGDVTLERSETDGPAKGSEFLVRLPISTLAAVNIDAPLIGTPPNGSIQNGLPAPTIELNIPVDIINTRSPPISQPKRTTKPKRRTFNPQLAKEYPLRILIAEDNAINRNVAIGSLNKLGYSTDVVTIALDGVEAVQRYEESLLKPAGHRFDAILMDIWMPNMDGFEATSRILDLARQHGETTKIIAVTADITGECLSKAEAHGMQGFLAKPYKVLDIEHLIVEHFKR